MQIRSEGKDGRRIRFAALLVLIPIVRKSSIALPSGRTHMKTISAAFDEAQTIVRRSFHNNAGPETQ